VPDTSGWARGGSPMAELGFGFDVYTIVARAVLADRATPKRLLVHGGLLCVLPAWALANALCMKLDAWVFPDFRRHPVRSPVFIVGNPRSGTTLLHRLLCGDTERFVYFRTWEILLPSLVQRKLVAHWPAPPSASASSSGSSSRTGRTE